MTMEEEVFNSGKLLFFVTKCKIVMSKVNSDDIGSLIAFGSQLIFVLHDNLIPSPDCLNPVGINRRCTKNAKAGNCLSP